MSKKIDQKTRRMTDHEYKLAIKRVWICLACLVPFILILTALSSKLGIPVWLAMVLNVVIGGLICLLVYIISDRIEQKKKVKKLLNPDNDDPFAD
ncbi:MAG: hypothetical protein J6T39_00740 [Clostridia bacterium]|nr:hypothetical protein [Clostridia bacterium]